MLLTLIVAAGSTILSYPFATFSYWPFELFSTAVSVCYSISCLLRQSYVIHVQNEIRHEQFICACLTQFAVHVLALNASACEVWYKAGLININNCLIVAIQDFTSDPTYQLLIALFVLPLCSLFVDMAILLPMFCMYNRDNYGYTKYPSYLLFSPHTRVLRADNPICNVISSKECLQIPYTF